MAIAIGLLKTLLELARSKKSGALDVRGGGARVRIFVESGAVVFADEGVIGETLGRILVREKVLTSAQYDTALERMAQLTAKGQKKRLGEILVDLKLLTTAQLDAALSAQVKQKVVRAIGWGSSSFRFVECHGPLEIAGRFASALEPLVLAALRLASEDHLDELLDLALTRYPELRGDGSPGGGALRAETLKRIDAFELRPAERAFALSLDGSRTSAEILGSTEDIEPAVVLSALLLTDCLDLHATARAAGASAASAAAVPRPAEKPAALRRLSPAKPLHAVKPAIVRKRAPSSVRPPAPEDKAHVKSVAARLKAAHEAKKSVTPPPPPSSPSSEEKVGELAVWKPEGPPSTPLDPVNRLLAEKAFQAGKAHVRANDMAAASLELKRAATLFPAREYELWAAWTTMRADKERETAHVPSVRALAEKALEEDPSLGFAYFVLGHLALRAFDAKRARELFAKARALDPATTSEAKDVRLREASPREDQAEEPRREPSAPAQAPKDAPVEEKPKSEPMPREATEPAAPAPAEPPATAARRPAPLTLAIIAAGALILIAATFAFSRRGAEPAPRAVDSGTESAEAEAAAAEIVSAPEESLSLDDLEIEDAAVTETGAPDTDDGG